MKGKIQFRFCVLILVLLGYGLVVSSQYGNSVCILSLNPCFVDEGASSGWSDRARPRGLPRILPCREYLHDTLIHLLVWRNPCFVEIWSFRKPLQRLRTRTKTGLNPCFVGIWSCRLLHLSLPPTSRCVLILVFLGCDNQTT